MLSEAERKQIRAELKKEEKKIHWEVVRLWFENWKKELPSLKRTSRTGKLYITNRSKEYVPKIEACFVVGLLGDGSYFVEKHPSTWGGMPDRVAFLPSDHKFGDRLDWGYDFFYHKYREYLSLPKANRRIWKDESFLEQLQRLVFFTLESIKKERRSPARPEYKFMNMGDYNFQYNLLSMNSGEYFDQITAASIERSNLLGYNLDFFDDLVDIHDGNDWLGYTLTVGYRLFKSRSTALGGGIVGDRWRDLVLAIERYNAQTNQVNLPENLKSWDEFPKAIVLKRHRI